MYKPICDKCGKEADISEVQISVKRGQFCPETIVKKDLCRHCEGELRIFVEKFFPENW